MDQSKLTRLLTSRKLWAAIVGFVAILWTAYQSGTGLDPDTVVNAIMGIVMAYLGATALEDGLSNRNATTTTVTTPASNVSVTATDVPAPTPSAKADGWG